MLVRRARGTVGSTVDPPAAAVRGAERIDELDHQTVLGAVGAGGERRGDVDEAHPQVIAHLADAEPAGIGEAPAQRVVDGPVDRLHGADEVDAEEVAPQRGLGVRVDGLHLDHAQRHVRDAVGPGLRRAA